MITGRNQKCPSVKLITSCVYHYIIYMFMFKCVIDFSYIKNTQHNKKVKKNNTKNQLLMGKMGF